jgi:hypothetical protein
MTKLVRQTLTDSPMTPARRRKLASLDRGETVDPAESRAKLRRKSQERRTRTA